MIFEKQQYQQDCVKNICYILENCDVFHNNYDNIQVSIKDHYQQNQLSRFETSNKKQIDVLMETGTGKTFTYLKTIFAINKKFGKSKFIIVLPRTAIKQGVMQNITLTKEYFYQEYKKYLKVINYPDEGLGRITQYFVNNKADLSVLVTTNSAFNSEKNNINKTTEGLFKEGSVWQGLKETNPIVIIDEPHLLYGDKTVEYLEKLDTLFIRFGATYPSDEAHKLSNVAYALDSVGAFENYLVKNIAVKTLLSDDEQSPFKVGKIIGIGRDKTITLTYSKNNQVFQQKIKIGEDIGAKTGLPKYNGILLTKITAKEVFLSNHSTIDINQSYQLSDEDIRLMIRTSIQTHFEKEQALFTQNIKALSLFFIPQVADFRGDKPRIKNIFINEYKKQRNDIYSKASPEYQKYLDQDFDEQGDLQVAQGYFSGDKGSKNEKEKAGVDLILKDKKKLLSFDEPLRFVFSVWALQEGWDNPNIFTICKLAATTKEISRRQQVGRGLRLAVNQRGKRQTLAYLGENESQFNSINSLDIVVSQYEKDFIQTIQQEIQDNSYAIVGDYLGSSTLTEKGLTEKESARLLTTLEDNNIIVDDNGKYKIQSNIYEFIKNNKENFSFFSTDRLGEFLELFKAQAPKITDRNKLKSMVGIRQEQAKKFKELWEAINQKATIVYNTVQEDAIIAKIQQDFANEDMPPVTSTVRTEKYNPLTDSIETLERQSIGQVDFFTQSNFESFIFYFARQENIPLHFAIKLFAALDKNKIQNNPQKAKKYIAHAIKENIHGAIVQNIDYQFSTTNIYPNSLQESQGVFYDEVDKDKIALGKYVDDDSPQDNFLYDQIVHDSIIEEESIQQDPKSINNQKITVFAKLPKINIPTPYKTYNPDFAYLIDRGENKKQLFFNSRNQRLYISR